jgi:hypothetical protein
VDGGDQIGQNSRLRARIDPTAAGADDLGQAGTTTAGEGWVVLRLSTSLPDGSVAYVHDVRPVVPDADYSVMRILYEAFPDERRELYDLYRGAFVRNVALASGSVVMDMRGAIATTSAPPSLAPPAPSSTPPVSAPSTPGVPQPPVR